MCVMFRDDMNKNLWAGDVKEVRSRESRGDTGKQLSPEGIASCLQEESCPRAKDHSNSPGVGARIRRQGGREGFSGIRARCDSGQPALSKDSSYVAEESQLNY